MKTTVEYLQLLRQYMQNYAQHYGITRMGIFGSVARGEQKEGSDIDICFEVSNIPTLFTLARIKYELEALLESPVDLIRMRDQMDEYLKQDIEREALYA
ncbi:nucleotidyltransferase family protein [Bacteroides salyersiae]|jgi:predicted nucleotidyltransferase|uniref:nucleotidyltransferase family protein n=1 Tax=Bacteroides salyersiae TaxID=291644 RepID=UPI001C8C1C8B|nr:nucleotidyltransferase family protein [Bacteroides salyersiae]